MVDKLISVCRIFQVEGVCTDWRPISNGLINDSYWVEFNNGTENKQYLVQRLNINVFKEPDKVMSNIERVTSFIKQKYTRSNMSGKRNYMNFYPTSDRKYYYKDDENNYWRISRYIENSIVVNQTDDTDIIKEIGYAFGKFQADLSEFPAETLHETINDFHETTSRYAALKEAIKRDSRNRVANARETIDGLLELEDKACLLSIMSKQGEIPKRVTHNDTKCNNVLLDEDTRKALCVIDLDTVMPGLVMHDFGDGARYICSTSAEDSKDLSNVKLDLRKFRAYTEGFLRPLADKITNVEKKFLAYGVFVMAAELSVRFLTDYINGDLYFKTKYTEHNLVRAKCQLALATNVLDNLNLMESIVSEYIENPCQVLIRQAR